MSIDDGSNYSSFFCLQCVVFLSHFFFCDDESDNDRSGSGSPGTCNFLFCSHNYVVSVSGIGSGVFVPTGIESIGDVVPLVVFVPRGVVSKVGQFIEIFPAKNIECLS